MKIIIIDDSAIAAEAPEVLVEIGHEVLGIRMDGTNKIFSCKGEERMSIAQAVKGADVVFIDHNMPTPGDELLQMFIAKGLIKEGARIIGISSEYQSYVQERIPWTQLIYKPDLIKKLVEK